MNTTTVTGNVTATPEVRVVDGGLPVTTLRLAHNHRRQQPDGTWTDVGEPLFLDVNCWRGLARNVADSLVRGDSVVVTGRLKQRSYVTADGVAKVRTELDADTVGADLSRHAARLVRRRDVDPREADDRQVDRSSGEIYAVDVPEQAGAGDGAATTRHEDDATAEEAPEERELVGAGAGGDREASAPY